jgi:D-serine deaminase-like pyridoxal phosphate-dependent protein
MQKGRQRRRQGAAAARQDAQVAGRRGHADRAGAAGICCAKLGEAEVFVDAGCHRHPAAVPLNPVNADRVFALADRITLSFIVDDPAIAQAWSDLASARGRRLNVLVKVDVGFHRCGIDPGAPGRGSRGRRHRVAGRIELSWAS